MAGIGFRVAATGFGFGQASPFRHCKSHCVFLFRYGAHGLQFFLNISRKFLIRGCAAGRWRESFSSSARPEGQADQAKDVRICHGISTLPPHVEENAQGQMKMQPAHDAD